ncbi:hypothetical protein CXB51_004289 [Gossypium anomalum]|uniref:Uncharacterized protein n=1 Tax=Gossypium anomalum TaxID=47600 RepID=A0A8J5ZEL2_9ROSI|nr:hypothetical protein CXB51_004289 [Gossypium anomalum]
MALYELYVIMSILNDSEWFNRQSQVEKEYVNELSDSSTPTISALTVVPRPEGKPEIAVLNGRERDERIDGALMASIWGVEPTLPEAFRSCCGTVGRELGLETLANDVRFWASESLGQLGLV